MAVIQKYICIGRNDKKVYKEFNNKEDALKFVKSFFIKCNILVKTETVEGTVIDKDPDTDEEIEITFNKK